MTRFLLKVIICALLATGASAVYLASTSGDPLYTLQEWINPARFQQHDALIRSVAAEHHLDPMLVKAVVWRESRFDAQKFGNAGERGLMQVSGKAAQEWARENHIESFRAGELFDPKVNLEAGAWYLRRAMQHWENQADPIPFALAQYNAGASRAQRWAGSGDVPIPPETFRANIDFPGTRKYLDSIIARYQFYKRRGRM
jgi:soluble lytic murein transglycosylase